VRRSYRHILLALGNRLDGIDNPESAFKRC